MVYKSNGATRPPIFRGLYNNRAVAEATIGVLSFTSLRDIEDHTTTPDFNSRSFHVNSALFDPIRALFVFVSICSYFSRGSVWPPCEK